jgi:hypothetical protein
MRDRLQLLGRALVGLFLLAGWFALTSLSDNILVQSLLGWAGFVPVALYFRWLLRNKVLSRPGPPASSSTPNRCILDQVQIMLRSPLKIAAIWLLSFCLMATAIAFAIDAPQLILLCHEHAETSGEVIRFLPQTHGLVEVRYTVAGTVFRHAFSSHLEVNTIVEGGPVRVYYSPHDPATAVIAPPAEVLSEQLPSWLAGSLLASTGIFVGILILWSSTAPFHSFAVWAVSPRVLSAAVTTGVLGGIVMAVLTGTLSTAKAVGGVFVVGGCAVFMELAWRRRLSWDGLVRSGAFWIAVALVLAGNILNATL